MMNPPPPDGYMWSLGLLYLVFAIVIAVLYLPTSWYAREKATKRWALTRYI
jgi:cytochrome c oxidase assembly factor CtaG